MRGKRGVSEERVRKYFKIPRPAKSEILAPAVPGRERDGTSWHEREGRARAHLDEGVEVRWASSVLTMGTSSSGPAPMALARRGR